MGFGRSTSRALKHTSRFLSKPFSGANKTNLRELEKVMLLLSERGNKIATLGTHQLRYGQFDFTWLTLLTDSELDEMSGEWVGVLQSAVRTSTRSEFAARINTATRRVLMNSTDKEFWNALQEIKVRYKKVAETRVSGFFKSITSWFTRKKKKVEEKVYRNKYMGAYATAYQTVEGVFAEATRTGARTDTDRQILAAGGLWRVVKSSVSAGRKIVESVLTPNPKSILKAVQSGVKVLNSLGGLIAGLADLASKKEADYRSLSARFGLDQKLEYMKKKYLGKGVIKEGDTLRDQMLEGSQRLEKAAEITEVELEELHDKFTHALWWCQNWKADIKEIEKDMEEHDVIRHLRQVFQQVSTGDSPMVKPSDLMKLDAFVKPDREQMKKDLKKVKTNVDRFESWIGPRLKDMEELRAKIGTRRSIAKTQRKTAALGLGYDTKRKIALEISQFDRSTLRSSKLPHKSQKPPKPDPDDLETALKNALAKRRVHIAPDDLDDDEDPDWDGEDF